MVVVVAVAVGLRGAVVAEEEEAGKTGGPETAIAWRRRGLYSTERFVAGGCWYCLVAEGKSRLTYSRRIE